MNKIKLMLSLTAAMVLSAAVSAQTLDEVNNKFNEGGAALQAKEYDKAATLFMQVIQEGATLGPESANTVKQAQTYAIQAYLIQGRAAAAAGNLDAAVEPLAKAQDLAQLYGNQQLLTNARQTLGQIYAAMGAEAYNTENYAKAIEIFAQGYATDPRNTDMALNLASSYAKTGDLEKAIEVFDSIIALETTHSRYVEPAQKARSEKVTVVLVPAAAAAGEGNLEEVVRLTDLIPEDPTGAMLRLQVANNKKDYRSVIQYGEAAAALQTDEEMRSNAYFLLGAAYQNQDNKAKAIESFRKVTAGPNAAQARTLITELNK